MKGFICGVLCTLAVLGYHRQDQEKPAAPPAKQEAAKADQIPVIPDAVKVKILSAKSAIQGLQIQFQACQSHQWQQEFGGLGQQMQAAVDEAFKEAKVAKTDYDVNTEGLVFVKKPAAPKPEEKKN